MTPAHLSFEQLEAGLDHVRQAPRDSGVLELLVRRPAVEAREELITGDLDLEVGLVGDNWLARGNPSTTDGRANREAQITVMNARAVSLLAVTRERWALAGDQLYVDLDISVGNLPPGTRLSVGEAVIEVTAEPHTGCGKFSARFGPAARRFVNSPVGTQLRLRGLNARVVVPGRIQVGDEVRKLSAGA